MTSRAKKLVAQAEQDIKEMEELLVRGMSEEEIAEFRCYLDRICKNLGVNSRGENTRYCGCGEEATHEKINE
jgi:hypothetical protein